MYTLINSVFVSDSLSDEKGDARRSVDEIDNGLSSGGSKTGSL